jgi:hypothetical protein
LPKPPGQLSRLISSLFSGIFSAVSLLSFCENPIKHAQCALGLTEDLHRAVIAEDCEIQLERNVWKLEEYALARITVLVYRLDISGDLSQVFGVVPTPALFS